MAEVQESGPLVGQPMRDTDWRDIFGGEASIVEDTDGTAFNLTLPSASDIVEVGSQTVRSIAVVGGFRLAIAAGSTQSITVPASTNPTIGRTDIIAVRLDPGAYTTAPGPCRLIVVSGVEGSSALPTLDEGPPGIELLPLWAVTRKQGQALNVASVVDLRTRSGPTIHVPAGRALPTDVPLGTTAWRGGIEYLRTMNGASPAWVASAKDYVDTAIDAAVASGPRPWYRRSRQSGSQDLISGTQYVNSANASGSSQAPVDYTAHIGYEADTRSAVGDRLVLKTSGVYTLSFRLAVATSTDGGSCYGYLILDTGEVVAETRDTASSSVSVGGIAQTTRYFPAGTKFRGRIDSNSKGAIALWELRAEKIAN
ncbi:MAG: hypothetical protein FWF90_11355 [Promicromonosporaceae bacterium]|nr:hypothetical protein [Promicromonosporaceae bacterium]